MPEEAEAAFSDFLIVVSEPGCHLSRVGWALEIGLTAITSAKSLSFIFPVAAGCHAAYARANA